MIEAKILDDRRHKAIAKNVRVLMNVQEVGLTHILHILNGDRMIIRQKIAGSIPFLKEELEVLAQYFEISLERLCEYDDADMVTKYEAVAQFLPKEKKESPKASIEPAEPKIGLTLLEELIRLTEEEKSLKLLLEKTYMAVLMGRVLDLRYYLRHNLLARAGKMQREDLNGLKEEEKGRYIDHFVRKYEQWQESLVGDMEEVISVMLVDNSVENVLAVVAPESEEVGVFLIRRMITALTDSENKIDIQQLSTEIAALMQQLQKKQQLLDEYLASH